MKLPNGEHAIIDTRKSQIIASASNTMMASTKHVYSSLFLV
jgi:hypothetical protein